MTGLPNSHPFSVFVKFWKSLLKNSPELINAGKLAIATLSITALLLGVRQLSWLQQLEVMAYDQMVRWREDFSGTPQKDPRLLVVGVSEEDIQTLNRWPLSDETIAQLLEKLSEYEPAVIGLDLYREIPYEPGGEQLAEQLKTPNVIVITNLGDEQAKGIPAPPGIPTERIGFNDIVIDPDGSVRRNLMFASTEEGVFFSFGLQLALHYLQERGISPTNSEDNPDNIFWGEAEFVPLISTDGGYQAIDDRGYQILLNYHSANNVARQVSVTEVLEGEVEPEWIKDKIVVIGTSAPSIRDFFLTPYSPAAEETSPKMSGVLVHAQMLSQILDAVSGDRPLFSFWSEWSEILWIFAWALAGGGLALGSRNALVLAASLPVLVCILGAVNFYLFLNYRWVPVMSPLVGVVLTSTSIVIYRAFTSQRQQQIVMRLLGQNTSPEVADALWQNRDRLVNDGKLPGQKLTATLLFTDLRNFSTISEQMSPEQLMDWLNEYLSVLTQTVQDHRGIINKFTGDGIMAAFGVPIARTTAAEIAADARSAVACGLAMGERLQQLNEGWALRGLPPIEMRVGIYTGPLVAGSLGGKERSEYGLIGDTVNIASRLESCAKERQESICRVLVGKETFAYIEDDFEFEHWGPMALKGKQQTIDVYRVLGWKGGKL